MSDTELMVYVDFWPITCKNICKPLGLALNPVGQLQYTADIGGVLSCKETYTEPISLEAKYANKMSD